MREFHKITEEFEIPGTGITLEEGDKYSLEEGFVGISHSDNEIGKWVDNAFDAYWEKEIKIFMTNYADQFPNQKAAEIEAGKALLTDLQNSLLTLMGGRLKIEWRA